MRQFYAIGFVILAWLGSSFLPGSKMMIYGGLGETAEKTLAAEGVKSWWEDSTLVIDTRQSQRVVKALCVAYRTLELSQEVVALNISQAEVTRTADGEPYRRQFLTYDEEGRIESRVEDKSDWKWIYDPGSPDAEVEGSHRGYVAMPNVQVMREFRDWEQLKQQKESIEQVVQRLQPDFVFGGIHRPGAEQIPLQRVEAPAPTIADGPLEGRFFDLQMLMKGRLGEVQVHSRGAGSASVATGLNLLAGERRYNCMDIEERYNDGLLRALNEESRIWGYHWRDGGNVQLELQQLIYRKLDSQLPVIVGLNGERSPLGKGHIVTLIGHSGDELVYFDPADGTVKRMTWNEFLHAPEHPDGNFVFYPKRGVPADDSILPFK